jgi:hypothetical protein
VIVPLLAVLASLVVWTWVFRDAVAHPLDPVALALYYLALQLLVRPFVLAVQWDSPFPSELFVDRDAGELIVQGQAVAVLWFLALWAGVRLLAPLTGPVSLLFPRIRASLPPHVLLVVALLASAAALAVTATLWSRYGGPTGLITAAKVDRDITESRALRSIPLLAALFSLAALFAAPRRALGRRLLALVLVALNGYLSWTWGARDVAVISVVALVAGSLLFRDVPAGERPTGGAASLRRWGPRLLLVPVCVLLVAFSLRAARDDALWGDLAPTIADQSTVRMIAVASNVTFYDSLLLVLDDWPGEQAFRGGADFVDAGFAAVPAVVAGEQEPFVSPAVQLAQTYLDRNNGFPATAVGDWYMNLGLSGVVLGGLLSGVVASAARRAMRRFVTDPLVWAFSLVFAIRVFPGGVWATSLPKWVAIGVPIIAVGLLVDLFARRGGDRPGPRPVPAARGPGQPDGSGVERTASSR